MLDRMSENADKSILAARILFELGWIAAEKEEIYTAFDYWKRALCIQYPEGKTWNGFIGVLIETAHFLSPVYDRIGDFSEAEYWLLEVMKLYICVFEKAGEKGGPAVPNIWLGDFYLDRGKFESAQICYKKAVEISECCYEDLSKGDGRYIAELLIELGEAEVSLGLLDEARSHLFRSLELLENVKKNIKQIGETVSHRSAANTLNFFCRTAEEKISERSRNEKLCCWGRR